MIRMVALGRMSWRPSLLGKQLGNSQMYETWGYYVHGGCIVQLSAPITDILTLPEMSKPEPFKLGSAVETRDGKEWWSKGILVRCNGQYAWVASLNPEIPDYPIIRCVLMDYVITKVNPYYNTDLRKLANGKGETASGNGPTG